jgi:hypothetical protein
VNSKEINMTKLKNGLIKVWLKPAASKSYKNIHILTLQKYWDHSTIMFKNDFILSLFS